MYNKNSRLLARVASLSSLALGLLTATDAGALIVNTKHNLSTSNRTASGLTIPAGLASVGDLYTTGTDEICVFCHTPHAASSVSVPLWNKTMTTATYVVYSSGTMQGNSIVSGINNNASLACLSCHDGTQAMDNAANAPGAGGYIYPAVPMPGVWSNTTDTTNGILQSAAGVTMLGTDLSNDHPIGMAYCGGGQSDGTAGSNIGCADPDFAGMTGSGTSWYVGNSSLQRENMRLYGTSASSATVECGSCHDVHSEANKTFLRTSNVGSSLCFTCHIK